MTWRWWAVLALIGASGCESNDDDRPDAGVADPAGRLITQSGVVSRGDELGTSVSVSADGALLAVGAPGTDVEGDGELAIDSAGAVYVFERAGDGWSMQAQVTAPQPRRGDRFGSSVSLGAGDILAVGAPGDNALGDGTGAVFVFARSGSEWTPMP